MKTIGKKIYHLALLLSLLANGTVMAQTTNGPTIGGSVYGGGNEADVKTNAEVIISGGKVNGNVYGGGKMGSVGTITKSTKTEKTTGSITMGGQTIPTEFGFAISVPYTFEYPVDAESGKTTTGLCKVNITGGTIGTDGDGNGDVYGAGRGQAGESYAMADVANVRRTEVIIGADGSSSTTVPDIKGSVYGGGENGHTIEDAYVTINGGKIGQSVYGSGKGTDKYAKTLLRWEDNSEYPGEVYSLTAGKVYGNAYVEMKGGQVLRNVYGGGKLASIGKGNYSGGADDYFPMGYGETIEGNLWDGVSDDSKAFLSSGKATVKVTGGTIGTADGIDDSGRMPTGNVFGGSEGEAAPNIFNQPADDYNPVFHVANINEAEVIIGTKDQASTGAGTAGAAPRIYGSVYGGGQDGHMRRDAKVTVYSGEIGNAYSGSDTFWEQRGNVFGAGSGFGLYTYDYNHNGKTYTDTNDNGRYDDDEPIDTYEYTYTDEDGNQHTDTYYDMGVSYLAGCIVRFSEVDIKGGIIHRNVYGGGSVAGTGEPKFGYQTYEPYRKGDPEHGEGTQSMCTVTVSGGTIGEEGYGGDVYGASRGDEALLKADDRLTTSIWTEVNIEGGTIFGSVYGGGEFGTVKQDTEVNLTGGEIKGDAYGGGKGTLIVPADIGSSLENPPYLGGNTTVELNKGVDDASKGCIVGRIFGCNNVNGTPKGTVTVHVYKTQNADATRISNAAASGETPAVEDAKVLGRYDVEAVYGGGNQAAYKPTKATGSAADKAVAHTNVIIDGCDLTSIRQVYGGGNAASTPATQVDINGTFEIEEAFGGGNGKDRITINRVEKDNPGANVGFYDYSEKDAAPLGDGTYDTKAKRQDEEFISKYTYGSGEASMNIHGGKIHRVYGGSNTKGNVRISTVTMLEDESGCTFAVDEAYGGGKSAPMDAESRLEMACIPGLSVAYGGAEDANIEGNVVLNITNGTFDRVFGGNNVSGTISGTITVNIEETGCKQVVIGQLYGGGNQASYAAPWIDDSDHSKGRKPGPTVNVRSFTSIGEVYGGGYGSTAIVTGDTHVNIDECLSKFASPAYTENTKTFTFNEYRRKEGVGDESFVLDEDGNRIIDPHTVHVLLPGHDADKIGAIGNVFGGGNAAKVDGNTNVMIGTRSTVEFATDDTDTKDVDESKTPQTVVGVDIRGNIYGGGNEAVVTGNTNVQIGKKE